ncbi:hypothetical protein PMZ80_008673 [Knufia obscura]|uniref:Alpha/beta-hydrolase n=1 Tax=Knufia obscura TaxID=1635080 RepID=A0ABR0RGV8_9EURO|nr:hypothetical protein PMZ80_008673 [Knufia obscura]
MLSLVSCITFASLLLLVHTLPTAPIERRAISSTQLSQFSLYEQYAAAAYCKGNNNLEGSISCPSGNCPDVHNAGATSILEFQDLGVADATGFVAVDDTNKLIVLSYRGSTSLSNWIGNINIDFNAFAPCSGCLVHRGFLSSWDDSKDSITATLTQAKSDHPDYSIAATGHSLGGAIATLAAADLRQQGFDIALYTYGSPMVGNADFANFVTGQNGGNYRVTHAADAVPKLPGYLLDYRHVSPEYWINAPSNQAVSVGYIQKSFGILDLWGNGGTLMATISDHMWYFNEIGACSSGFEL